MYIEPTSFHTHPASKTATGYIARSIYPLAALQLLAIVHYCLSLSLARRQIELTLRPVQLLNLGLC